MDSSGELFMRSQEGYFGVHFSSFEASMKIKTKIILEWAYKSFVMGVHIYYFISCKTKQIREWR